MRFTAPAPSPVPTSQQPPSPTVWVLRAQISNQGPGLASALSSAIMAPRCVTASGGVQGSPAVLLATATSLDDARIKLQALESGTAGVLLRTDDPAEVP